MIEVEKCPDCGHGDFFLNKRKGELICRNCSFVVDDAVVDLGQDTRGFDEDGEAEAGRTGAPFDPRVTNNLTTAIGDIADIARLPKKSQMLMSRLRKRNFWTSNAFEQNLSQALQQMRMFASRLELPERVEKESAMLYRRAAEKGLAMRSSIERLVIASLYLACRVHGIPKTLKEFGIATKMDAKVIAKTYKLMLDELSIHVMPTDPIDYTARFASGLKLSAKTQTAAIKLIEKLHKSGRDSGLSPVSIAATMLYIAGIQEGEKRTQREISQASGITETTLRNRTRDIADKLEIEI
ncbi:hypothetical protein HY642_02730 [Candidatus Woesearchaeota archaeon]|nr:hypothetical protein [Candidatus Woesearchaeota archaeon]